MCDSYLQDVLRIEPISIVVYRVKKPKKLFTSRITDSKDEIVANSKCKQHILPDPCCQRTQRSGAEQNRKSQNNITTAALKQKYMEQKEIRPVEHLEA